MKPNLEFLDVFEDKYLKTQYGKGVFLAGVLLGYMARLQVAKNDDIHNAPLFKQLNFGKVTARDLKKHLSRVPELIKAYRFKYSWHLQQLANVAGALLLQGGGKELGVDGNFAFTVGFANASDYFWNYIFEKEKDNQD
ncbi:CRISPR-associated protein [Desulfallas sp. Bu1-1]|uniref:TM1802 family CRISPR-associated protein n=1 Tax=Desulfallas sp. Bu1-1 TaxID=2787620 RepID=UPI00189F73E0|nr:TM1802 family CRISPR-associated protein [Desulfallas sp. Bu1-1]MBF7082176.1 CRISPR-associated protein [Desulfallas sp. Bu1-1]